MPVGGHHHRKSDGGSGAAVAVGLVLGLLLIAVLGAMVYTWRLRKQVRDMTMRLELADGGAADVPLFVGATDVEDNSGLPITPTSAYMPPTTPRSGADDELDTDSVAGEDVAGDVY